jgi:hypothetical protein
MGLPAVKNVAAAKPFAGGGVYYTSVLTTALPTDATTALNAAFKPLGYVGEDGIRPARDTSVNKVKAFGGDVVAALLADESRSFEFDLLEVFSQDVNEFVYGTANVTTTAAIVGTGTKVAVQDKGGKPVQCIFVFELKHGAKRRRLVVPIGDPTITNEAPYTDDGLTSYTVQVETLKNASGVRVYDYMQNDDAL